MLAKKRIKHSGLLLFLLCFGWLSATAQETVNQEVKVVKPYVPVVSDAFKISQLPKILDTAKVVPEFEYEIMPVRYKTGFQPKTIKPARLISEPITKLYYAYLKVGYGSYLTPMADLFVGSKRNEDWKWGVRANHLSSHGKVKNETGEKVYAGFSNSALVADGTRFFSNDQSLGVKANYNNKQHYYYGYNPALINESTPAPLTKDEIENQKANFIIANANWKSNYLDSTRTNFDVNASFQSFSALNGIGENALKISADINYFFEKEFIGFDAAINSYSSSGIPDTIMQSIVKFNPWIGAFGKKWQIVAGVNTYLDQMNQKYYFYPRLSMHYNVIDYFLIPYVELSGGLKEHSYQSIFYENPYISQSIAVLPTNTVIDFSLGFRGNISSKIAFNVKANYSDIKNQYFYVNDTSTTYQNKFDVVYDDVTQIRVLGELSYQNNENLSIRLKGNYYNYSLKNELKAWHKPDFELSIGARYKIQDKIIVDGSVFAVGARYAREFDDLDNVITKELQGVVDLNLGVEYRLSKNLSAFLQCNNLTAVRYQQWNNYPTQRFNIMGGVTYSF